MKASVLSIPPLLLAVSSMALADPSPPKPEGAAITPPSAGAMPPYATPAPGLDPNQPAPRKTHSPALIGGGIALVGLGAASIISGAVVIAQALQGGSDHAGGVVLIVGIPLLIHGAGCAAGGIPMIAIGAKKIPVNASKDTRSPTPLVMMTPRSASLSWSF